MLELIITIAILGVIVWAVTKIPMPEPFRVAIYAIAVIMLLLYLASFFGHPIVRFPR